MNAKVEKSIELLKKAEKLAIALNDEGFKLAFSGGKDSQVMYQLAKMAEVRFHAYYNITTNDPPENVYFIRNYYKDVTMVHPKETYTKLIEKKGLPLIHRRYCCAILKESFGAGSVVLLGVRREESRKRAKYEDFDIMSRRKEHQGTKKTLEQVIEANHECIKGQDKIIVRPILEWTEKEIWQFIYDYNLPINKCYEHVGRVGCMFCPFSSKRALEYYEKKYPKFRDNIVKALGKYMEKGEWNMTAEEYYEKWKRHESVM